MIPRAAARRARRDDSAWRQRSEHQRRGRPRPGRCGTGAPHRGQVMPPFSVIAILSETIACTRVLCEPLGAGRGRGGPLATPGDAVSGCERL
jgi:hypothetical protein